MLHTTPPSGFESRFTIVGCCIETDGKILILRRAAHKPQGGMWGLPAGKVDLHEDLDEAIVREVFEETGIPLERATLGKPWTWYIVLPFASFVWVVYRVDLAGTHSVSSLSTRSVRSGSDPLSSRKEFPTVVLHNDEHVEFGWFTPGEIVAMEDGIDDLNATLVEMYGL